LLARHWFLVRVLIDECLPRHLARELSGHDVRTVTQAGWSGIKNGELVRLAAQEYDALLTIDQHLASEQPVPPTLAIVTLVAPTNRMEALRPLVPAILHALTVLKRGERVRIGV
jgi:hypothetical protein